LAKITRLKIEKFRNIAPGTELVFADGINVLLGKNGTGKTTLLRLLEAITRLDFSAFADEEFSLEVELRSSTPREKVTFSFGNEKIVTRHPDASQRHSAEARNHFVPFMRADVVLGTAGGATRAVVETKNGVTITKIGSDTPIMHSRPILPTVSAIDWNEELVDRVSEADALSPTGVLRFDEALGFYDLLKTQSYDALPFAEGVVIIYADDGLIFYDSSKTALGDQALSFGVRDSPLAAKVKDALGIKDCSIKLNISSKDPKGNAVYNNLRFWLTRADGSEYSDEHLSFGQKRVVSFLAYLDGAITFVIADEIVNGLHHAWVDLCVESIGDRQAFLTSQNPLLMDHLSFNDPEEIRCSFILCSLDHEQEHEILEWQNMATDQAQAVFEASETGIGHLSTILRNQGLW
jgi:energy-coupling factor transporter ATP-binding protein EcfA2